MDKKITELSAYSSPIATDLLAIVDITTVVTKKITLADLTSFFGFWALDGNTNGAEKSFGNVDNFNIPFIINNEQVGKWIRVNSSIMGLDLGVSNARAGNLQLHTTVSATPWLSADESNGVKIRDFYTLGLGGNVVAMNVYNNMAASIYAATANSQVAIITKQGIGIGHITSGTFANSDAVSGVALDLGDTNLSVRNAAVIPTTEYVNGFLLYSADRSGAGTASPFILTENGTLIDLVGLALGGGSIPAGTVGQTLYYAANGTVVTATSNILNDVAGDVITFQTAAGINVQLNGASNIFSAGSNEGIEVNGTTRVTTIGDYGNSSGFTIIKIDDIATTILYQATAGHEFTGNVGIQTAPTANALEILGDTVITGKLTVTGAIDPTHLYLDEQAGDPSNVANKGILYTKDVGALTQLFYMDSAGTVKNISATGAGTVTSVSGTSNRISSTGGATPVIDIDAAYVGQTSITTLGTIGTGTWQGSVLNSTYGGTGINNGGRTLAIATNGGSIAFSSPALALTVAGNASITGTNTGDQTIASLSPLTTLGDIFIFTTVNARLAGNITTTKMFLSQTGDGALSAAPAWASLSAADINSGTLGIARGGTNKALTLVNGGIIWSDADSFEISAAGTTGQVLQSNAAGAPTWGTVPIGMLTMASGGGYTVAASTTAYGQFFFGASSGTESNRLNIISHPCTIKNLYVRTSATQSATGNMVVTIRKNGAGTALTLTIPAGQPSGIFTDLVNSFTVAAGDRISIEYANAATATSTGFLEVVCGMYISTIF